MLRLIALSTVPDNLFYDAAVRSMTLSLHNFFYGAFDPSAATSIDKPPIDLWLQVIAVKLFGWSSVALKLPEAIAGTAAMPLLYDLVRRVAGPLAALGSAITLALLPTSVVTARSDTMDSVMMLLLLAIAWLLLRSVQRRDGCAGCSRRRSCSASTSTSSCSRRSCRCPRSSCSSGCAGGASGSACACAGSPRRARCSRRSRCRGWCSSR